METAQWKVIELFDNPVNGNCVHLVEEPSEKLQGIEELVRKIWDDELKLKQADFASQDIDTDIRPYHLDTSAKPFNALYLGNKAQMWPGPSISLKKVVKSSSGVNLFVSPLSFPYIKALRNKTIEFIYHEAGINKPSPSLAICTFAKTLDNQLTLTVRSSRTSVYPKRLYGQGGNPETADIEVYLHQQREMEDEILVNPFDYGINDFNFLGIAVDNDQILGKPDLIGWVPVRLDSDEIQKRVSNRSIYKRPHDAAAVIFAPAKEGELFDYLTLRSHPFQFCPPAHAGLVLYGRFNYGEEWSNNLLKKLEPISSEINFLR